MLDLDSAVPVLPSNTSPTQDTTVSGNYPRALALLHVVRPFDSRHVSTLPQPVNLPLPPQGCQ